MGNKLYVGNLSYGTNDQALTDLFSQCGSVSSVKVIMDRDTGRSKGFAFIEMGSDDEAQAAIQNFDGKEHDGRQMRVNEAKPQERNDRGGRGGGGGRY